MFVALDETGNRVYAEDAIKNSVYYCQKCGKEVKLRKGKINKPHFAHIKTENCKYGKDGDHMSEWHIRMQEYFPKESREYRFKDIKTGEIHIADIYIESDNTVLEFQHSRIEEEEFLKRTWFHLNNGRRIVWLFDESTEKDKGKSYIGRLRFDGLRGIYPHNPKEWFKWINRPRKCLINGPDPAKYEDFYSICVYNGEEGETFRKILNSLWDYSKIALSDKRINIKSDTLITELFDDENYFKNINSNFK